MISFYNTLSGKKELFYPLEKDVVKMYTCGPTVYDYAHIGNFRAYIFEDLLRRFLEYKGYKVIQVMNLTDIDDKTIKNAIAEGVSLNDYTKKYIDAFFEDINSLRIEKAEYYPRATEHISEMVELIKILFEKGYAYESDGSVYYRISKFKNYGKLSKKKIDENLIGARVDHDEYGRDDLRDFVLWKKHKEGEPYWDSSFGKGRPGWHIECSAMSMKYLGETFDIHTGGEDNIFPHHENEIAQSEGATGKEFARYWLHCKFLLVENEKMSKSKGNFHTLRSLTEDGYSPLAVRFLLLTHNYRHPLNFTYDGLKQASKNISRINDFYIRLKDCKNIEGGGKADSGKFLDSFEASLDDDLNIAKATAALFDFISSTNKLIDDGSLSVEGSKEALDALLKVNKIYDILDIAEDVPDKVSELLNRRIKARESRDYALADKLRDEIYSFGWIVEDTPFGPRVKKR